MKRFLAVAGMLLGATVSAQSPADAGNSASSPVVSVADGGTAPLTKVPLAVDKMLFSPGAIRKVIGHHQDEIQACYESTLAEKEKVLEGKLMTSFVITPEGMVKKATVKKGGTSLKDPKLHECVVGVLSSLTFPKPPDKRDHPVMYPFNLKTVR
ncbi:MAG: AgmX/PglI C-terminal domain-containing protein [Myxococcaceae bacterium]